MKNEDKLSIVLIGDVQRIKHVTRTMYKKFLNVFLLLLHFMKITKL